MAIHVKQLKHRPITTVASLGGGGVLPGALVLLASQLVPPGEQQPEGRQLLGVEGPLLPLLEVLVRLLREDGLAVFLGGRAGRGGGGGGGEGSHVTRFIQSGCLDAPIETHSILREPPTCKPLEAVKIGADWSGVKSPLRPLNLKPLCAPTRSNLFIPLRSTTRSTLRSAHMLWWGPRARTLRCACPGPIRTGAGSCRARWSRLRGGGASIRGQPVSVESHPPSPRW